MEPKTIGKFIAALRRANGYTQRELADKLCVSDKAVSRWERDECAPDLTLLPVIAEIFGITTDELLRGERNSPDHNTEEPSSRPNAKSEKQLKNLMRKKQTKYRNLSLIAAGIAAVGLIAAMICNFGFLRARIGLLVGSVFYLAAVVCQICFANLSLSDPAEEDEPFAAKLRDFNYEILTTARNHIVAVAALFTATLPLTLVDNTYMGLNADSWFAMGIAFCAVFVIVCFLCNTLFFDALFTKKTAHMTGKPPYDPALGKKIRRLFLRFVIIAAVGAILPATAGIVTVFLDETLFVDGTAHETYEDFKTYIEQHKRQYYVNDEQNPSEGYYAVEIEGETQEGVENSANLTSLSKDGRVLIEFQWNNHSVVRIKLTEDSEDGLPIRTYELYEIRHANSIQENICIACVILIVTECALCLVTFFFKQRKLRRAFAENE